MAIQSFGDSATERFFIAGKVPRKAGWSGVRDVARRKLDMLHYAAELKDLLRPPANRLEELRGRLRGLHSIRVNDRWRVVFQWKNSGPHDVAIVDYH
jgi:proteic killer suppression protein